MTSDLEQIAEEMVRIFQQQMIKTPVGLQNLSEDAKTVSKLYLYRIEKWGARIRAWIAANKGPTDEEETQEILNDPRTMEALRIAKQQRAEGNLLESAVGASWAAHNQTASKGPLGSGSPNPRSVVAATPGAAPLCSNCGANPPNYCYSCWERQESPQRKAFADGARRVMEAKRANDWLRFNLEVDRLEVSYSAMVESECGDTLEADLKRWGAQKVKYKP